MKKLSKKKKQELLDLAYTAIRELMDDWYEAIKSGNENKDHEIDECLAEIKKAAQAQRYMSVAYELVMNGNTRRRCIVEEYHCVAIKVLHDYLCPLYECHVDKNGELCSHIKPIVKQVEAAIELIETSYKEYMKK
ncbi:hypothetical protein ACS87_20530 [Vibrio parahaemolyticus]|uniref:hypothetical protein n=1 Tax=Vibrio parahaemolyticus TaxID=670 RepID=UPI0006A59AC5|nr:hypothetical protein [Vibrio parahaemolyticus]KOE74861.1 hypothetical protein ACS87_20530 [Vibrio parahaemolyticus]